MVVMAPSDEAELATWSHRRAIDDRPDRLPLSARRGRGRRIAGRAAALEIGKGRVVREGTAVAILSLGTRLRKR
jgi:1-deoxy-D-xylulose-5-phosphate synthase